VLEGATDTNGLEFEAEKDPEGVVAAAAAAAAVVVDTKPIAGGAVVVDSDDFVAAVTVVVGSCLCIDPVALPGVVDVFVAAAAAAATEAGFFREDESGSGIVS